MVCPCSLNLHQSKTGLQNEGACSIIWVMDEEFLYDDRDARFVEKLRRGGCG